MAGALRMRPPFSSAGGQEEQQEDPGTQNSMQNETRDSVELGITSLVFTIVEFGVRVFEGMDLALEPTSERQVFKLVLLGSTDVGKSSLVLRYTRDDFRETVSTTGCAFFSQRVYLQGKALDFEIWDTAGQERYHSVCHLYYRGASAALLVYDISSKETFTRAQLWLQELQKYVCSGEMVIALVGNKSDLQDDRKVSAEDAKAFAEQKRLLFMETSAKRRGMV
ncbi:unnamed protein product [Ranitomeya imitator]|uniref:Ras-related protein Rab-17 n=1 Tax=Ranitomeya imitator TaxID=111125 RepID=A0ABN9KUJ4_9NEOB|nr:unnamed protein product [Ranitomeya imitator]